MGATNEISGPQSRKLNLAQFPRSRIFLLLLTLVWSGYASQPDLSKLPPSAKKPIDFVRDIQPILSTHCYSCHGADKQENELRWDRKASALKGGTSGSAIIAGKSGE